MSWRSATSKVLWPFAAVSLCIALVCDFVSLCLKALAEVLSGEA